jgi:hypothetical protein
MNEHYKPMINEFLSHLALEFLKAIFRNHFAIIIDLRKSITINFYLPSLLAKRKTPVRNTRSAAHGARDVGNAVRAENGVPYAQRLLKFDKRPRFISGRRAAHLVGETSLLITPSLVLVGYIIASHLVAVRRVKRITLRHYILWL